MLCTFHLAFAKPAPKLLWLPNYAGINVIDPKDRSLRQTETLPSTCDTANRDELKNTHPRMNRRSGSSRRNGAALWCGVKDPAGLLKTFIDWGFVDF
jgi:hypothetical protein